MTYEEKRSYMLEVTRKVEDRAQKADLYYVICFWFSPLSEQLEHRQGYFDEFSEAYNFKVNMSKQYKNWQHYINI